MKRSELAQDSAARGLRRREAQHKTASVHTVDSSARVSLTCKASPSQAGAIYDHVVPPHEGVPTDGAPCGLSAHGKSKCREFDFRRLGLRAASMLISPWVKAGSVFQECVSPCSLCHLRLSSLRQSQLLAK